MPYHKRPYSYSAKKANFYGRRSTASSHVISGSCFLTDVLASGCDKPLVTSRPAVFPNDTVTAHLGTSSRGYDLSGVA